jgi:hypothetical protein
MKGQANTRYSLSAKVGEFDIPPVTDGLLIGIDSPIGFSAVSSALNFLAGDNFVAIELEDDTVSHLVVRPAILRRIPQEKLIAFALERLKPLMCAREILHLDLKVDVTIEDEEL